MSITPWELSLLPIININMTCTQTCKEKWKARQLKIVHPHGPRQNFNLQAAIGLKRKKKKYLGILRAVHHITNRKGIDMEQTISYQSPLLLGKAMKEVLFLTKLKDGWPVKEILQQYLQNKTDHERRRRLITSDEKDSSEADDEEEAVYSEADSEGEAAYSEADEDGNKDRLVVKEEPLPVETTERFKNWLDEYLEKKCRLPSLGINCQDPGCSIPQSLMHTLEPFLHAMAYTAFKMKPKPKLPALDQSVRVVQPDNHLLASAAPRSMKCQSQAAMDQIVFDQSAHRIVYNDEPKARMTWRYMKESTRQIRHWVPAD
ncbi:hypothetical protein DEU56DRAFT_754934 [Suillus clintonianus]|uniref:uncharacterized protein n=1 Tax=Suillus clintonianus TaxID=1904413 RepID=UPI001B875F99|nr:uncharacterized protein DEU56DRAFT_754934 [Suillus clintonianus]KAG2141211.1 hypothetical protein DEU56DRAFT_754934 [Suillus clintonianus]